MRTKNLLFYVLMVSFFTLLIVWMVRQGGALEVTHLNEVLGVPAKPTTSFLDEVIQGLRHPIATLILQIVTILLVARLFGSFASRFGQPVVVGEILAGIVLGPSLLGLVAPGLSAFIFPPASLGNLQFLSQMGLIFFMFIIGMELDVRVLRSKAQNAVVVSHTGIVVPYFLGILLAYFVYENLAPEGISFLEFSLFMGIALSITAFPVLARIIQERGLTKTNLGALVLTSAAIDDITAWSLLAVVVALVKAGSIMSALVTIGIAAAFVTFMFVVVQPLMKKIGEVHISKETLNKKIIGIVFLVLLGSSYMTEVIGMNSLIGAFLAGVVMPQNLSFKKILTEKIEDVSLVLFLPLFFVYTGLRTQIGLLNTPDLWLTASLIIVVAVVGKLGAITLSARFVGQTWRDSLFIGTLMNTRGLMELIVLNIGYDLGILSQEIFTMLVLMALVTTLVTGPLLNAIEWAYSKKSRGEIKATGARSAFKILISFGPPKMGATLLRLADQLTLKSNRQLEISALHITPSSELKPADAILFEKEGFQPIRTTAQLLGVNLFTLYRNTEDVEREIFATAQQNNYDLVLVGAAKPIFNNDKATGGILKQLLDEGNKNVGVLVDRGFVTAENVLMLVGSDDDKFLLQYADRLMASSGVRITILSIGEETDFINTASPAYSLTDDYREVIEQRIPDKHLLGHFNLVLVSLDHWNKIMTSRANWIKDCPSILVVQHAFDLKTDRQHELVAEPNGDWELKNW